MNCLNCKKEISEKAKYCSDACRMAYTRRTKQGEQPEQRDSFLNPNTPTRTTKTDQLFEDRHPGYYKFGETVHQRKCLQCGKGFKTTLSLLRSCSPECYVGVLEDLTV